MIKLYSNDKTKQIDQLAADYLGVDSFELMQLAGAAVYAHLKDCPHVLVITGPGNNGGDGFVVAELARQQGQVVHVLALHPPEKLTGDAQAAAKLYQGEVLSLADAARIKQLNFDVIVDALFGTGLMRTVTGSYADVIQWVNQQSCMKLAIDIPSGLNGSSGQIEGVAVRADKTIAILANNTGLYTQDGSDCCGEVSFESLHVPEAAYQAVPHSGELLHKDALKTLSNRANNSHKGDFGHVLTAGGQAGMLGAVLLAGRAVLKAGAGSTTVITDASHAHMVPLHAPELMSVAFDSTACVDGLAADQINRAKVLLCGMGLGQSQWSKQLFKNCVQSKLPLVLDADGLNLLAQAASVPKQLAVITPHPGEAANLLRCSTHEIQNNRWQAVQDLAKKYQCVAVLKGSGTLIADGEATWCCPYGNANLATAGSGDVLAGMVAGLMAQGCEAKQAAQLAVLWHAICGERSAYGMTLTASELLNSLHLVINSET